MYPLEFAVNDITRKLDIMSQPDFSEAEDIALGFFRPAEACEFLAYLLGQCKGWAVHVCPDAVLRAEVLLGKLGRAAPKHKDVTRISK